jgi:predicted metal-dependent hydrolase
MFPKWFKNRISKQYGCAMGKAETKTVEIVNVGTVLIERSGLAKHLSLSVKPFRGARVAVPIGVSFAAAEMFARSKAGWLKKHLDKMVLMEQKARALSEHKPIDWASAKKHLINRLDSLSQAHGFKYNRVFIKNQKTRWGSCSGKNNINLNINLIRLPNELIDYTILHELVHTRIKNHGRQFWDQMDKLVGNSKKLDKKLNDYKVYLI